MVEFAVLDGPVATTGSRGLRAAMAIEPAAGERRTGTQDGRRAEPRVDIWRLIWQLAGVVGLDPGPFTLRELVWMADAKQTA